MLNEEHLILKFTKSNTYQSRQKELNHSFLSFCKLFKTEFYLIFAFYLLCLFSSVRFIGSFRPIYDAKAIHFIWPILAKAFIQQSTKQIEIIGMDAITSFHIRHTHSPASISMWQKLGDSLANNLLTQLKIIVILSFSLKIHYDNSSGIKHYSLSFSL